ncbi:MAG: hypothetical protein HC830_13075, partial [Bacteroidetes bacterium]|nr:hypothetical protein [Bacteroidota bacterium]
EKIETFEDACEVLGITTDSCKPIFNEEEDVDEIAYKKLKVIIRAVNNGWLPDWDNLNQHKWFPVFALSSGFGFSYSRYDCTGTLTYVGSRLCFETEEKAITLQFSLSNYTRIYLP